MRKIASSGKTARSVAFSERADSRSRPNGFSMTTRAPLRRATGFGQVRDDRRKRRRRNGQVIERPLRAAKRLAKTLERARVVVVTGDELEQRSELVECRLIEAAVGDEAGARPFDQVVEGARACDADHREPSAARDEPAPEERERSFCMRDRP